MTVRAGLPAITRTICPGSINREAVIWNNGQFCGDTPVLPALHASELKGATLRPLSRRLFTAN